MGFTDSCRPDEFRCNDGMCLEDSKVCNGYAECRDGSDESHCNDGRTFGTD
jgi:Low-density lipoprotein receptor domain class A.